jgi:hypothetical protein
MKNSQFIKCDETCFPSFSSTHLTPKTKKIPPKTPLPPKKELYSKKIFKTSKNNETLNKSQTTGQTGFWLRFKEDEHLEQNENHSICSDLSEQDSDINDDFFEFEIDENGNWSSVESQLFSEEEEGISGNENQEGQIKIQKVLFESDKEEKYEEVSHNVDLEMKSEKSTKDEENNKETIFTPEKKIIRQSSLRRFNKNKSLKVSSLKEIKGTGFVSSFKNLNSSLVFNFCKNMSLVLG